MRRLNVTTLLVKPETTYGEDSAPTSANIIPLRGKPTLTPLDATLVPRDLLRPYLGNGDVLPGSAWSKLSFEVEASGSGTAGVAGPLGWLLKACATSENIMAAAETGTAQAGGTTATIKLAAGASSTDDFYTGLPITLTGGTGSGNTGFIVDYNGTTKVAAVASKVWVAPNATSTYSIGPGVVYRPGTAFMSSVSCYMNIDGVLHKFFGARGNAVLDIATQKVPFFKIDIEGVFQPVVDEAVPPYSPAATWRAPLVCTPTNTPFFDFHETYATALESLSFDFGVALQRLALANSTQQVVVDKREPKFKVSILAELMAVKNWYDRCLNATAGDMVVTHGLVAGNRFTLSAKSSRLSNPQYGGVGNTATLSMDGVVLPVNGNDDFSICFH